MSISRDIENGSLKILPLTSRPTPPERAIWQRHILRQLYPASQALTNKYTRPDRILIWRFALISIFSVSRIQTWPHRHSHRSET